MDSAFDSAVLKIDSAFFVCVHVCVIQSCFGLVIKRLRFYGAGAWYDEFGSLVRETIATKSFCFSPVWVAEELKRKPKHM